MSKTVKATKQQPAATINPLETLIKSNKVKVKLVDIETTFENPENPQKCTEAEFEDLKRSIKEFPELMILKPVMIDGKGMALAGNKRRRACYALGWKQIPVVDASDFTPAQQKRIIIVDNVQTGRWDKKILRADWKLKELKDWGVKINEIVKKVKDQTVKLSKPAAKYYVQVACANKKLQTKTYNDLTGKGLECTMVNTAGKE